MKKEELGELLAIRYMKAGYRLDPIVIDGAANDKGERVSSQEVQAFIKTNEDFFEDIQERMMIELIRYVNAFTWEEPEVIGKELKEWLDKLPDIFDNYHISIKNQLEDYIDRYNNGDLDEMNPPSDDTQLVQFYIDEVHEGNYLMDEEPTNKFTVEQFFIEYQWVNGGLNTDIAPPTKKRTKPMRKPFNN